MTGDDRSSGPIAIRLLDGGEGSVHVFRSGEVTLGRGPHCDLRLGAAADPVHCIVARTRHGYVIEDLRSTGGTRVDGRPIQQAFVELGARIEAGGATFVLLDPATA